MSTIMGSFVTSDRIINVVIDGAPYSVHPSNPSYRKAFEALKNKDGDAFIKCLNTAKALSNYVEGTGGGRVTVDGSQVLYDGKPVHNCIASRIREMMNEGSDFSPMVAFLENLMQNPSYNSREQLYKFLEHKNLPITDDGCFLAYKTIRSNWYDKFSGTIKNNIGAVIEIDRGLVDDNPSNHCSHGLHVGALEYAGPGGWYNSSNDIVIIVKVNPRDAVSVPGDHSAQKLRVCRYSVVCQYKEPLYRAAYTVSGDEDIYDDNKQQAVGGVVTDEDLYADDDFDTLDTSEIQVGEIYSFTYQDKYGNVSERVAYCESVGDDYMIGELVSGDPSFSNSGEEDIRRFNFNGMTDIMLCD